MIFLWFPRCGKISGLGCSGFHTHIFSTHQKLVWNLFMITSTFSPGCFRSVEKFLGSRIFNFNTCSARFQKDFFFQTQEIKKPDRQGKGPTCWEHLPMRAETLTGEPATMMLSCLLTTGGDSTVFGLCVMRLRGGDDRGLLPALSDPRLSGFGEGG